MLGVGVRMASCRSAWLGFDVNGTGFVCLTSLVSGADIHSHGSPSVKELMRERERRENGE